MFLEKDLSLQAKHVVIISKSNYSRILSKPFWCMIKIFRGGRGGGWGGGVAVKDA